MYMSVYVYCSVSLDTSIIQSVMLYINMEETNVQLCLLHLKHWVESPFILWLTFHCG